MYINPTLTSDEFKTIHNAVCDLDMVCHQLEDILKPELYLKLAKARNQIREGLARAYQEDRKDLDAKHDHYDDVRSQLGLTDSVWSVYEVNNLSDRHPFEGADRVVYKDHWGDKPVQCSVNGLTWAALYVAANACIRDSGDNHHIYIEQFTPSKDDPRTLILSTGS